MISLQFEVKKSEEVIAELSKTKSKLRSARRSALSSCGAESRERIDTYIENQGDGSWPATHQSSLAFRKNKAGSWISRRRQKQAYSGMGNFVRYSSDGLRVLFGFGYGKTKAGKDFRFNRLLEEVGRKMQQNHVISVSPRMRRMFGAQRNRKKDMPGVDFFPIKKTTNSLFHPARMIAAKAIVETVVNEIFETRYESALRKLNVI